MTDKVQKIKEWVRTRKLCTMDEHMKFYCKEAESDYNLLCSIEKILDSMQEEHVSEDLEKEIEQYEESFRHKSTQMGYKETARHFAQWQKQQMMNGAVDVTVRIDAGGYPYIPQMELYDYDNDIPLAKEGDKYKVILIKED